MPLVSTARLLGKLSLFWRTFLYLALLLAGSILAWQQTFHALETEPRALHNARQIASLVNLTRAALTHSDPIARVSLVKALDDEEGLRIAPREPGDKHLPYDQDEVSQHVTAELLHRLGKGTIVARQVNGVAGLWVGFKMGDDTYWLQLDPQRLTTVSSNTWLVWLASATVLSLAGAAVIARLINRPLQHLSFATTKLRDGDFAASHLDEQVATAEIRQVNAGFNRMAKQLAQIEHDRALMLAGISHDLRTPLARLRLEAEMSVPDPQSRADMVADIAQVDGIIDKFLDYARPGPAPAETIAVAEVVEAAVNGVASQPGIELKVVMAPDLMALADPVDLLRVLNNLLENARRYGKTPGQEHAEVSLSVSAQGAWVCLRVADHGPGANATTLARMTQPFFRGDAARSQASGAGLGLAVVEKMVHRMGGEFELQSPAVRSPGKAGKDAKLSATQPGVAAPHGGPGLLAVVRLQRAGLIQKKEL